MAIEKAPQISKDDWLAAMVFVPDNEMAEVIDKINDAFEYWDTVKYKKCPAAGTPARLWTLVKAARAKSMLKVWEKYGINLSLTSYMQRVCHHFDMNWGGSWGHSRPYRPKVSSNIWWGR